MSDDAGGKSALSAGLGAWLPIETAPTDGTKVLCYTNDGYKFPLVSQCLFDDGWWPDVWESPEAPLKPTHWMPLPAPPASA